MSSSGSLSLRAGTDDESVVKASGLVRAVIGVVTFAVAGQSAAVAAGHAWSPWSAPTPNLDAAAQARSAERASIHSPPSQARRDECPPEAQEDGRTAAPGDEFGQVLTVVVPASAILETDRKGRLIAATTNTGCPPRPTDELWIRHHDGSFEAAQASALRGVHWYAAPADADRYLRHPRHP